MSSCGIMQLSAKISAEGIQSKFVLLTVFSQPHSREREIVVACYALSQQYAPFPSAGGHPRSGNGVFNGVQFFILAEIAIIQLIRADIPEEIMLDYFNGLFFPPP